LRQITEDRTLGYNFRDFPESWVKSPVAQKAVPILSAYVRDVKVYSPDRCQIVRVLARIGGGDARDTLIELTKDIDIRTVAISALSTFVTEPPAFQVVLDALWFYARDGNDEAQRRRSGCISNVAGALPVGEDYPVLAACETLIGSTDASAIEGLSAAARDGSWHVRIAAISSLRRMIQDNPILGPRASQALREYEIQVLPKMSTFASSSLKMDRWGASEVMGLFAKGLAMDSDLYNALIRLLNSQDPLCEKIPSDAWAPIRSAANTLVAAGHFDPVVPVMKAWACTHFPSHMRINRDAIALLLKCGPSTAQALCDVLEYWLDYGHFAFSTERNAFKETLAALEAMGAEASGNKAIIQRCLAFESIDSSLQSEVRAVAGRVAKLIGL
jgi:HEAT repeat protein